MSIRKREWTSGGVKRSAWVVNFTDATGKRRLKTFARRTDAEKAAAKTTTEIAAGVFVADRASITVDEAAKLWLKQASKLERSTAQQYEQHVRLHIVPLIGAMRLSALTAPKVAEFQDALLKKLSPALTRKIVTSLSGIVATAQRRGLVAQNVVKSVKTQRVAGRHKRRLEIGVDVPTVDEVRRIITAAKDERSRAFLSVAFFTGLRASELRGLRWSDVELGQGATITVRQRVDAFREIGSPKSAGSRRSIPIGPATVNGLKAWRLASPRSADDDLVFGTRSGSPDITQNIVRRLWQPTQVAAHVVDEDGRARYSGLHSARHFAASWMINRPEDGGLGLPAKSAQERLGHASIILTLDTYGHLFPVADDAGALARAEARLLSPVNAT